MTNNIELCKNAYIDETIKKPDKLIAKLRRGRSLKSVYLICVFDNDNRVQIISSRMFMLKTYRNSLCKVYAMFPDETDAYEYIRVVAELSYKKKDEFIPIEVMENITKAEVDELYYKETR